MIELTGIRQYFRGGELFAGLDLTIAAGECVALTGPSGSGKSTLARILAGHLRPDAGAVRVDGRDVTGIPGRHVLLIHQESDLFPWQRVTEQVRFALTPGAPEADRRVSELLRLVKLEGCERHFPRELSGGMRKRLAIARALAAAPRLLILDEAFGSLDPELRAALSGELKAIWEATRATILVITHSAEDVEVFGQRVIQLGGVRPTRILAPRPV